METRKNDIGPEKNFTVIDTSVVMEYPDVIKHIVGQTFVPLTVIMQLDGLKNNPDSEKSKQARMASFFIEKGIQGKKVAILTQYDRTTVGLDNESDNKIVGAALRLKQDNPDANVTLFTTDRNMRIVASGYGIVGMDLYGFPLETAADRKSAKVKVPFYSYVLVLSGAAGIYSGFSTAGAPDIYIYLPLGIVMILGGILSGLYPRIMRAADNRGYLGDTAYSGLMAEDRLDGSDIVTRNLEVGNSVDPKTWTVP